MKKRIAAITMLLGLSFVLTTLVGCNTVQGAGRDIEDAGDAIEDAAE